MKSLVNSGLHLLLAISFISSSHAQVSAVLGIDSTQSLGNYDYIYDVEEMGNGNLFCVGRVEKTLSSSGGQVYEYGALLHLDPQGNILYSKRLGYKSIHTIEKLADGNYVIAGAGSGFQCVSGFCKSDILVTKIDMQGNVIWGRSFGNPIYNGSDGARHATELSNGDILVTGNVYEASNNSNMFVARLTSTGDTVWTRSYGASSNQFGYHAAETANGSILVCYGGSGGMQLIKLNAAGNKIWSKKYSPYGGLARVFSNPDGSIIIGGDYMASNNNYKLAVAKLDTGGNVTWFKDYSVDSANYHMFLNDMTEAPGGGYYLTGYHYSFDHFTGNRTYITRLDAQGNITWSRNFNNHTEGKKIMPYSGGGIIVAADYDRVNNGKSDMLFFHMADDGILDCLDPLALIPDNPPIVATVAGSYAYRNFETVESSSGLNTLNLWRLAGCAGSTLSPPTEGNYPQPEISVSAEEISAVHFPGNVTITIMDMTGKTVLFFTGTKADISFLSPGIYVAVADMQGKRMMKKFGK